MAKIRYAVISLVEFGSQPAQWVTVYAGPSKAAADRVAARERKTARARVRV